MVLLRILLVGGCLFLLLCHYFLFKMFNFYNIYSFCVAAFFCKSIADTPEVCLFFVLQEMKRYFCGNIFFCSVKEGLLAFFCFFTFTLHITHTRSLGWRQMGEYWGLGDDFCVCVNRQVQLIFVLIILVAFFAIRQSPVGENYV